MGYGERSKFGEHQRSVTVAPGTADNNPRFLSVVQSSQVHHNLIMQN